MNHELLHTLYWVYSSVLIIPFGWRPFVKAAHLVGIYKPEPDTKTTQKLVLGRCTGQTILRLLGWVLREKALESLIHKDSHVAYYRTIL